MDGDPGLVNCGQAIGAAGELVGKLPEEIRQKAVLLHHRRPIFSLPLPVCPDGAQLLLGTVKLRQEPTAFAATDGKLL